MSVISVRKGPSGPFEEFEVEAGMPHVLSVTPGNPLGFETLQQAVDAIDLTGQWTIKIPPGIELVGNVTIPPGASVEIVCDGLDQGGLVTGNVIWNANDGFLGLTNVFLTGNISGAATGVPESSLLLQNTTVDGAVSFTGSLVHVFFNGTFPVDPSVALAYDFGTITGALSVTGDIHAKDVGLRGNISARAPVFENCQLGVSGTPIDITASSTSVRLVDTTSFVGTLTFSGATGSVFVDNLSEFQWQDVKIDNGTRIRTSKDGWGILSEETQAIIGAMNVRPPASLGAAMEALVARLKETGWWDEIGYLLVPTLHTEQASLLNWKDPTSQPAINHGAAFAAFQGFTGNGVDAWIDTVAPSTVPGLTTPNEGHVFGWFEDGTIVTATVGSIEASPSTTLSPRGASNQLNARVNQSAQSTLGAVANRNGLSLAVRTGAAAIDGYRNGVTTGSDTDAATAIQTNVTTLLTTIGVFADDRVLAYGIGGSSVADPAELQAAFVAFFDAIGTVHSSAQTEDAETVWMRFVVAPGATTLADDVTLLEPGVLTFENAIPMDGFFKVTAAGDPGSSAALRSASGGLGDKFCEWTGDSTSMARNLVNSDNQIAAGAPLFLRRTDDRIGGILYVQFMVL